MASESVSNRFQESSVAWRPARILEAEQSSFQGSNTIFGLYTYRTQNKETGMQNSCTAVTKKDGEWWIGWIEEVPGVNCQEKSHSELLETLKVTLKEAIELNRDEALTQVSQPTHGILRKPARDSL